jgi:fermentation-respiration switch protein FrsA (DUF1100 family)
VKEQATGAWGSALAERGFAALSFDHRYFGESAGRPRQLENPAAKIADIQAATASLHSDRRFASMPMFAVAASALAADIWREQSLFYCNLFGVRFREPASALAEQSFTLSSSCCEHGSINQR